MHDSSCIDLSSGYQQSHVDIRNRRRSAARQSVCIHASRSEHSRITIAACTRLAILDRCRFGTVNIQRRSQVSDTQSTTYVFGQNIKMVNNYDSKLLYLLLIIFTEKNLIYMQEFDQLLS